MAARPSLRCALRHLMRSIPWIDQRAVPAGPVMRGGT
jgi:hypothetical protein